MRFIVLLLVLVSTQAMAVQDIVCTPKSLPGQLKLDKSITLLQENCTFTDNEKFTDICTYKNATVFVGKGVPSILVFDSGKTYKLDCIIPQRQQEQQQQQQQQQQQRQQSEGEPGHGGNTVGPR